MTKELEEAKKVLEEMKYQIQIKNKKIENDIYDNDIFASMYEERNSQIQTIQTVLNYIDNSISKEVIEKKKNKLEKQYKEVLEKNSIEAFILKCQIEILKEILEEK